MSYNDEIIKSQKQEKPIIEKFLAEARNIGVVFEDFHENSEVACISTEYVNLVDRYMSKFTTLGTINWVLYSLSSESVDAFRWLIDKWLYDVDKLYILNEGAREIYNRRMVYTKEFNQTFEDFCEELKSSMRWTTFQALVKCVPKNQIDNLFEITKRFRVNEATEAFVFLAKKGYKDLIVKRVINELEDDIINRVEKSCNCFTFLAKDLTAKEFIPYLTKIKDYKIIETSSLAKKLLKQKRYQF